VVLLRRGLLAIWIYKLNLQGIITYIQNIPIIPLKKSQMKTISIQEDVCQKLGEWDYLR